MKKFPPLVKIVEEAMEEESIDLKHGSRDRKYVARLITQRLFNFYREGNGDLDDIDNILCDYAFICNLLEKVDSIKFRWGFYREITYLYTDNHVGFPYWEVTWDGKADHISIQKIVART